MNMNKLASVVAGKEKGKKEVNIAQIKEVMKVLAIELRENPAALDSFLKYVKRVGK